MLRLLSSGVNNVTGEPADAGVRGWWEGERFHLRTALGREGLTEFFLHRYAPSPVIAPWNGRAGFLEGEAGEGSTREGAVLMRSIEQCGARRFRMMRSVVRVLRENKQLSMLDALRAESKTLAKQAKGLVGDAKRRCLNRKRRADARVREIKGILIPSVRSATPPEHAEYVDSCVAVAATDHALMAPLLGAGGLDGSRDFGVRFAAELAEVFDLQTGVPRGGSSASIALSLFRRATRLPRVGSIGQFSPGDTGPNASTGYSGTNPLNPWDLILAMEGTILFVGAITRQMGDHCARGCIVPLHFRTQFKRVLADSRATIQTDPEGKYGHPCGPSQRDSPNFGPSSPRVGWPSLEAPLGMDLMRLAPCPILGHRGESKALSAIA